MMTPRNRAFTPASERADGVARLLDAVSNRAREGARVVEDYLRFVLADGHLTRLLKDLRHELTELLTSLAPPGIAYSRDVRRDVGAVLSTPGERTRRDAEHVASANFKRTQEALRSLEEFGKLQGPGLGARFEALRYRLYTIEQAAFSTADSRARLASARLYVLVDGRSSPEDLRLWLGRLVEAGVDIVQLRDKNLDDRALLARARLVREVTTSSGLLFIMNDRPDLAALSEADGVHLGQTELSVEEARAIVGPRALVGVSTHSIDEARQAVLSGANYLGVGPTFPSGTKKFAQFPGLPLLQAVASEISLPAFAIGGIGPDNLPEVMASGFSRIAVSGAILTAANPVLAAQELRGGLGASSRVHPTIDEAEEQE